MPIDILSLEPSVISRDLKGKYICIYGMPKVGKTTMACQFPKNLLLGFEHGWNAIAGAMAIDIPRWADFKLVLRQLDSPQAHEKYDTITIDTVGIAYDLCEQYICAQNGVQKIGDIPYGAGYGMTQKEFDSCLRKITQMGYGLCVIAHVDRKSSESDETPDYISPLMQKRCYAVINQLVDIIGYIDVEWDESGTSNRWLYTKRTPNIVAGSRFKYLPEKIPFGYQELVTAIADAIDKEEKLDGAKVVDSAKAPIVEQIDFGKLREEARTLWEKIIASDENKVIDLAKKIEIIFGKPKKLSEVTEDQASLLELMVIEMRDMAKGL